MVVALDKRYILSRYFTRAELVTASPARVGSIAAYGVNAAIASLKPERVAPKIRAKVATQERVDKAAFAALTSIL